MLGESNAVPDPPTMAEVIALRFLPLVVLALVLSGCFAPAQPQSTPTPTTIDVEELDIAAIEAELLAILPAVADGFLVDESTGVDEGETFGNDWSVQDHEAARVARAVRSFESVGWADRSLGAGFWFDIQVVLMESLAAADAAMYEIAGAVREPYTLDAPDGSVLEFAPLGEPSGRFPFGALEQERRQIWPTGERASGWATFFSAGPFIVTVYTAAVPDAESPAALEAFAAEHLPPFLEEFDQLPTRLLD